MLENGRQAAVLASVEKGTRSLIKCQLHLQWPNASANLTPCNPYSLPHFPHFLRLFFSPFLALHLKQLSLCCLSLFLLFLLFFLRPLCYLPPPSPEMMMNATCSACVTRTGQRCLWLCRCRCCCCCLSNCCSCSSKNTESCTQYPKNQMQLLKFAKLNEMRSARIPCLYEHL